MSYRACSILLLLLAVATIPVLNAQKKEPTTANEKLLAACMSPRGQDSPDDVTAALKEGADINIRDERSGQTCFMAATLRGKPQIVRHLLQQGADTTIPEKDGYTPPHGAGFQGRPDIMKLLKEEGKMDVINAPHKDGYFPLHRACWGREERHAETVQYLLDIGEDVNRKGGEAGKTCIEMTKNPHTIQVLTKFGAVVPPEQEL